METVSNAFLSLVGDSINTFRNCPNEFESMKKIEVKIRNFVEDVGSRKFDMKTLHHFTNELRELMYDVEDITADYSRMNTISRLGIGKKLKDINEKLGKMKSDMEKIPSIAASGQQRVVVVKQCDRPVNDVTQIVGLEKAISKIKNWMLKEDSNAKYNFIGLVGKGGSGKTTLAQMILKDEDINNYSNIKKMLFVTVSQPVDVKMIMKNMLKKLKVPLISGDGDDELEMSTKIHESLKGSRYFLVLDDVWSLDGGWWKTIKNALPEGSENCVLITSRMKNIVLKMGVGEEQIHEPEALGEEDGWTLFCKNISTYDKSKDDDLKKNGKEIVRKCGGLPLAIKVMGGVVPSCDISTGQWRKISKKFMESLSRNNDDSVLGSLGLSYDELRGTYLQPCLLCFGVFPEDCVIEKDRVIRWWIGEGFVPLTKDGRLTVKKAEKCFKKLVNRSLIEVVKRDYNGEVRTCKVHDLVRELLIRKGKSEAFFEIGENKISRRIIVNDDIRTTYSQISASNTKLRAVVYPVYYSNSKFQVKTEFLEKIYEGCKYLRVLHIPELQDYHTLSQIGTLEHLTCLCVYDKIPRAPDEIRKLRSLLVLVLGVSVELPDSITQLNQLIILEVLGEAVMLLGSPHEISHRPAFPKGLGNVSTLQVMKGFSPSHYPCRNVSPLPGIQALYHPSTHKGCRFEELRRLTQLVTLELEIKSHNQLSDGEVDALSKLVRLQRLTIKCRWSNLEEANIVLLAQQVDKLVLPKCLDEVKLMSYPGDSTPSWLNTENLPHLRYLSLHGGKFSRFHENFYEGEKWEIIHMELVNLLYLEGDWKVVRERMPKLETVRSFIPLRLTDYPPTRELEKGVWRRRA